MFKYPPPTTEFSNGLDLTKLTVASARKALDAKEFSSVDLTKAYLAAIKEKNPILNAYLEVWEKSALEEAAVADEMIKQGKIQMFTGIPVAVKDNIMIEGRVASSASKMLEHYVSSYDSNVIKKLKSQGTVFLGRTNMDEFAMGSSTENSAFGTTKNPIDITRVPGGSSGGSAAAVAGNLALIALGSDTGGSIRQPASHCGIVGLLPTYGSVSRSGLMPMGSSLDVIGPIAKTVEDAQLLYEAIRGNDPMDSTTLPDYPLTASTKKVIGVPRSFIGKGIDPDVLALYEFTLEKLKAQGYEIRDIEMPNLPYALPVYYIVCPAEVSTNLARYDGIRYGLSVAADVIKEVYTKTKAAGFGPEVKRRILIGTFVLSSGYSDAYYRKARAVRQLIAEDFERAFKDVDAVALPTSPNPAFKIGSKTSDPLAMYLEDIFSVTANLAHVPAISVPAGTVDRDGVALPVGFQLVAAPRSEATLFTIGAAVQNRKN